MKVMILGSDGYIGYQLALHLLKHDYLVFGVDNGSRRERVADLGSNSLTPILDPVARKQYLIKNYPNFIDQIDISLGIDYPEYIAHALDSFQPDTIVHLAEQPSAPWSMIGPVAARETQRENVIGTLDLLWAMKNVCPEAHLVKLGTMGEYGTPSCNIPEGKVPEVCLHEHYNYGPQAHTCPMQNLMFPRTAGSFYHLTKVHDTHNIEFACRIWNFRSTDIMQGVLFGLGNFDNKEELTRFDYDECFGTVINRFCAQALINYPLTIYGNGTQTRGYLPLKDSLQCLTIAIDNPPKLGEYRTFNQFESLHSVNGLADMVCRAAYTFDLKPRIAHLPNPRIEAENHYYNPAHNNLFNLGYKPTTDIQGEVTKLLQTLLPYTSSVIEEVIAPTTLWK